MQAYVQYANKNNAIKGVKKAANCKLHPSMAVRQGSRG